MFSFCVESRKGGRKKMFVSKMVGNGARKKDAKTEQRGEGWQLLYSGVQLCYGYDYEFSPFQRITMTQSATHMCIH